MVDLQGSFWTSGLAESVSQSANTITTILNDETQCKLPVLLGDSDILQECKSSNPALLEYLSKPDTIEDLMSLIGSGSSDPKSEDERLAYVASEIVACEMQQITDAIISSDIAMHKLFNLIASTSARVDDRRAGHFRKAAAILIQKHYKEVADFLNRNQELILAMIHQIDNTSVLEVLIMIGWDDGNIENTNDRKWLFDMKFIPAIVKIFGSEYSELQHINASQGLIDMVLKCPIESTSILVSHLCSPAVLSSLINNILSGSPSSFENGIGVLSVIAQRQTLLNQDIEDQIFTEDVPFPIAIILDKLPAIIDFGRNSPYPDPMPSSMGGNIKPLGAIKLKMAELVLSLLRTGFASVQTKVVETGFIPLLISYFFEFKWNSILHFIMESVALSILNPKSQASIIQEFLQHSKFVPQAIALYEDNQKLISQRKAQYGNIGHVLRILNLVVELSLLEPSIKEWIHEDTALWRAFISEKLRAENQKFSVQLGGFRPEMEQSKPNGPSFAQNVPVDDDFLVSSETNFEHDVNSAQTEAIFDMMNNPSNSFDNEPWPGLSFDDQEFHVVEDGGMFENLPEFSSSNSEIVNPIQESNTRTNSFQ